MWIETCIEMLNPSWTVIKAIVQISFLKNVATDKILKSLLVPRSFDCIDCCLKWPRYSWELLEYKDDGDDDDDEEDEDDPWHF